MAAIVKRQGARGTAYRVQFRDAVGHQAVKTFHRLEDARRFKAQVEHERPDDLVGGRVSLADVYNALESRTSWSASSLRQHGTFRRALEAVDSAIFTTDLNKLSPARLEATLAGVSTPLMGERIRTFLNQLLREAKRPPIPNRTGRTRAAKMARAKTHERPLETSEIEALLVHLPERYRTMTTLQAYCGLRPGEAYGLQAGDYDPVARTLTIQRAVSRGVVGPTKTGLSRTIPVGGLGDLIEGHIKTYELTESETFLFTDENGKVINENVYYRLFRRAAQAAGIPNNVSPNSLRHHAAAWMIQRGANILAVSKMLGHAKPSITMDVYAYLFSDSLDAVASILPRPQDSQKRASLTA